MNELGLQFLESCLRLLVFGQIADEAGKVWFAARLHFADRKVHRKRRSVFALTSYNSPDADNMSFPRRRIASQITIMTVPIGVWHQHADILADSFLFGVAKLPFRCSAEELHDTVSVDHDHRVGDRLQNRAKVTFPDPECFFDLLLLLDIDNEPADVTRRSFFIPYDATKCAYPLVRLSPAVDTYCSESPPAFDQRLYGLIRACAVLRLKQ